MKVTWATFEHHLMVTRGCESLTRALCSIPCLMHRGTQMAVVSREKGNAEGARVIMGLKGWTAALQSWPVLLSSSVMLGKLARFPMGDCDKVIHCFVRA